MHSAIERSVRWIAAAAWVTLAMTPARAEADLWPDLRREIFQDRAVEASTGEIALYAPEGAEDAAIVPISIRLAPALANTIKSLVLVVDRNPAPIAATFTFGPAFKADTAIGERAIATRIRVDSFSKVRAIAETHDGRLVMADRFVAGAGGCSAPASKDMDEAMAAMGRMKVQAVANPAHDPAWREAVIQIRHPNFTGLQRDPKTGLTTPAMFIRTMQVTRGDALILAMDGGISISEDPNFRFNYAATATETLDVTAIDTEGRRFSARSVASGS